MTEHVDLFVPGYPLMHQFFWLVGVASAYLLGLPVYRFIATVIVARRTDRDAQRRKGANRAK